VDLEALASVIANTVKGVRPSKTPQLRLVDVPPRPKQLFDQVTRDACLKRIRFLRKAYSLTWLVEQHTFDAPMLESLTDEALSALLRAMEKARECISDGVSFDDAGLVESVASLLPHDDF
jgi:hypothetical protein